MTNTEKIDEVSKYVAILSERVDALEEDVARVEETHTQVAILEHRVNQLEKNADRWQSVRDKLLFLILGAVITLIVKRFWP
jgi:outer membrane murein-binding lipoprotein Lpp